LNTDQFVFVKLAFIGAAIGKYARKSSVQLCARSCPLWLSFSSFMSPCLRGE
jgi:hypothetical protein